jgi:TonB family protein
MTLSLLLHAGVMLLLLQYRPEEAGGVVLAEIDYVAAMGGSPATPEPVEVLAPVAPQPAETQEHFRRSASQAEVEPAPQSDYALADRMAARLDALRDKRAAMMVASASAPVPTGWSAAGSSALGPAKSAPVSLQRGGSGGAPLSLSRGAPVRGTSLEPATVAVPRPSKAEAAESATTATRDLAGARLSGPVADRPIVSHTTPIYPDWAKREAVEGSVTLFFYVRPDGSIKENVLVQKTAGFEDFDQSAVTALRAWRFQALSAGRTGEQWGTITFHFRLRDAG